MRANNTFLVNSRTVRSRQVPIRPARAGPWPGECKKDDGGWARYFPLEEFHKRNQFPAVPVANLRPSFLFARGESRRRGIRHSPILVFLLLRRGTAWDCAKDVGITEIVARTPIRDGVPYHANERAWPTKLKYANTQNRRDLTSREFIEIHRDTYS